MNFKNIDIKRIQSELLEFRWAVSRIKVASPLAFWSYGIASVLAIVFPAAIALSLRGLVNSAGEVVAGAPLTDTSATLWLILGFMATIALVVISVVLKQLAFRIRTEQKESIHLDILQHHASLPFSLIETSRYQDWLRRAKTNPEIHTTNIYTFSWDLFCMFFQLLSLFILLIVIEPLVFFLLIPISLPYLIFKFRLYAEKFNELDKQIKNERLMGYYSNIISDVSHAGELKVFDLNDLFIHRWHRIARNFRSVIERYEHREFISSLFFSMFSVAAVYLALAHVTYEIANGETTIGDIAIFGAAAGQLRGLINSSINKLSNLRLQKMYVQRLCSYFSMEGEKQKRPQSVEIITGNLAFRNVSFSYPDAKEPTLYDVSFSINPGETVALVGENGSGKSTIAKLIAGLYQPNSGQILFDGHDEQSLNRKYLDQQIACVFQHFCRYNTSVHDNIAFGDWTHLSNNSPAVEEIAKRAQIHELILDMPDGYSTVLGRQFGHHQPSGGQWQQLAITRLMARDARLLVMDEPTANLDPFAEQELYKQIQTLTAERATLIISHRFTTVALADRIIVIDNGRIVENGSHDELMHVDGKYASMFKLAKGHSE